MLKKAIILAAGVGARLRPMTAATPKCLLPIGSRPLLDVWIRHLAGYGIRDILVNTHHLSDQVAEFLHSFRVPGVSITVSHEPVLLGSAGTIADNWRYLEQDSDFLVCNGDTLTDVNIRRLYDFHEKTGAAITLTLFETDRPTDCGIVELGENGSILSFEEKPRLPKSKLANGGVYVMSRCVQGRLPRSRPADIGCDLLPRCVGEMYGWKWTGLLHDIGTLDAYAAAHRLALRSGILPLVDGGS